MPYNVQEKAFVKTIKKIIKGFKPEQPSLLPALHAIQDELGYIPKESTALVAQAFNISVAEVHAVLQFYAHYRTQPPAKIQISLCQAEACLALQAKQLTEYIQNQLNCSLGEKRADNLVQLDKVYCLGLCTHGPVGQINQKTYVQLTPKSFNQIINELLP